MADSVFSSALDFLIRMGFLNTLVPFILYYAVVFGMLERTQIFTPAHKKGKPDAQITNLHSLIAFAIAITATAASQAVGITQNYLPVISVVSIILLGIMMILGMAFGDKFDVILSSKVYVYLIWGFAFIMIGAALVVVAYYSGLVVTPCSDKSLTPVNSMNAGPGECTKMIDLSNFPNAIYVMGINPLSLIPSGSGELIFGLLVIGGAFAIVIWLTKSMK